MTRFGKMMLEESPGTYADAALGLDAGCGPARQPNFSHSATRRRRKAFRRPSRSGRCRDVHKPLFRQCDRQSMQFAFDLWSYADVNKHAAALHPPARPVTDPPIRTIPVDIWAIRRR